MKKASVYRPPIYFGDIPVFGHKNAFIASTCIDSRFNRLQIHTFFNTDALFLIRFVYIVYDLV